MSKIIQEATIVIHTRCILKWTKSS